MSQFAQVFLELVMHFCGLFALSLSQLDEQSRLLRHFQRNVLLSRRSWLLPGSRQFSLPLYNLGQETSRLCVYHEASFLSAEDSKQDPIELILTIECVDKRFLIIHLDLSILKRY